MSDLPDIDEETPEPEPQLSPEELALRDQVVGKAMRFFRAFLILKIGLLSLVAAILYKIYGHH